MSDQEPKKGAADSPEVMDMLTAMMAEFKALNTRVGAMEARLPRVAPSPPPLPGLDARFNLQPPQGTPLQENVGTSGGPEDYEPLEEFDPFGHDDPYMPRGRGRRDQRMVE